MPNCWPGVTRVDRCPVCTDDVAPLSSSIMKQLIFAVVLKSSWGNMLEIFSIRYSDVTLSLRTDLPQRRDRFIYRRVRRLAAIVTARLEPVRWHVFSSIGARRLLPSNNIALLHHLMCTHSHSRERARALSSSSRLLAGRIEQYITTTWSFGSWLSNISINQLPSQASPVAYPSFVDVLFA